MANFRQINDFLTRLGKNNNREWFQANKSEYDLLRSQFVVFMDELIEELSYIDISLKGVAAKNCIFRIYRDVRFSNDKSPYKTNFGAFISASGVKGNRPGYYLHLEPGQSFLAGGLYMPPTHSIKAVRDEIYFNSVELVKILSNPEFTRYFDGLDRDDVMVKPPKGYPSDFAYIEWLKFRSFTVSSGIGEDQLYAGSIRQYLFQGYKSMYPFIRFLNKALDNLNYL